MKTPKEFFKHIILPLLVFDVFILFVVLTDPISFYLRYSGDIPQAQRIKTILGFLPTIILPYFFVWSPIYLFLKFLYFKKIDGGIYSLVIIFAIFLKFTAWFVLFILMQLAKT